MENRKDHPCDVSPLSPPQAAARPASWCWTGRATGCTQPTWETRASWWCGAERWCIARTNSSTISTPPSSSPSPLQRPREPSSATGQTLVRGGPLRAVALSLALELGPMFASALASASYAGRMQRQGSLGATCCCLWLLWRAVSSKTDVSEAQVERWIPATHSQSGQSLITQGWTVGPPQPSQSHACWPTCLFHPFNLELGRLYIYVITVVISLW